MNFLKKFPVAVAITVLTVIGCICYSAFTLPAQTISVRPGEWIQDEAGVLSAETEEVLTRCNRGFDDSYSSIIAVATTDSTKGWTLEDYAYELAWAWELGPLDFVFLMDIGSEQVWLVDGGDWPSTSYTQLLDDSIAQPFYEGDYDRTVLALFEAMDGWYAGMGDSYQAEYSGSYDYYDGYAGGSSFDAGASIAGVILLLLIVFIVLSAVERSRYDTWHRSYGHMATPTVRFVPIFPWHRHGSPWFVRMGRRPPPPPPPPPGGFGGGHRPPSGGGARPRPSNYRRPSNSSFSSGPRGGGFNSRPRSSGGGFGGGRRPSGGSRGGGFGGSRGGGFGGGRGGGFGRR